MKTKNENQSYMQMWENNATLETHDPIARVQAMLEQSKKRDVTQRCMEQLNEFVIAGRANLSDK